jgi:hypothetical protein
MNRLCDGSGDAKNAMTHASDAQWAAAVARERVVRFLAAQSPIRGSDIDAAEEEFPLI